MAKKYKTREIPHRVSVATLPNGYAFTVDGHEYICFTAEQLVNEVFVRLGLEMLEYVDHETLAAIVEACAKWQDIKSALMANATLMAETKRAHSNENVAIRAQARANEQAEKYKADYERLWRENVDLRMEIEQLQLKLKKFDKLLVGTVKPLNNFNESEMTKGQKVIREKVKKHGKY
jgi:hypothetical protein